MFSDFRTWDLYRIKEFKKYLDETICWALAAVMSSSLVAYLLGWRDCMTLQYLQETDDYAKERKSHDCRNCRSLEDLDARITKSYTRTFSSGPSIDLYCSYVQYCSSSGCFNFHLCPAVPKSFLPSGNFHAISRCLVVTQDELYGFKRKCKTALDTEGKKQAQQHTYSQVVWMNTIVRTKLFSKI